MTIVSPFDLLRKICVRKMQGRSSDVSFCPSFSSYSPDQLADIAARVRDEGAAAERRNDNIVDDDGDEFQFVLVRANPDDTAPVDGGEAVCPIFPLFNRDLLLHNKEQRREFHDDNLAFPLAVPLKKLFMEGRDPPSSSSSEADELEGITPGTYCVWRPKTAAIESSPSPGRCEKSNSTGSSPSKPRWRLRDLLRRSSSDGKDSFVFFRPHRHSRGSSNSDNDSNFGKKREVKVEKGKTARVDAKGKGSKEKVSAHEVFYVRSKASKEGDKRIRSYLPYRQGLVGFFANVNW